MRRRLMNQRRDHLRTQGYSLRRMEWISRVSRMTLAGSSEPSEDVLDRFLTLTEPYTNLPIGEPK